MDLDTSIKRMAAVTAMMADFNGGAELPKENIQYYDLNIKGFSKLLEIKWENYEN